MFDKMTRRPVFFLDGNDAGGGNPPDADKDKKKKENPPEGEDDDKKQKDMDKQYAERAKRAAESQKKVLYESLGVKDDAEFEAYVKTKAEADDKQKTETQKLADQAKKAHEKAERVEAESKTKLDEMQKRILDSEIKILAAQAVTDKDGKVLRAAFRPEALETVLLLVNRSTIEEKDGKYVGIDKALAEVAKAHAYTLNDDQPADKSKGTPKGPAGSKQKQKPNEDQEETWFRSL